MVAETAHHEPELGEERATGAGDDPSPRMPGRAGALLARGLEEQVLVQPPRGVHSRQSIKLAYEARDVLSRIVWADVTGPRVPT